VRLDHLLSKEPLASGPSRHPYAELDSNGPNRHQVDHWLLSSTARAAGRLVRLPLAKSFGSESTGGVERHFGPLRSRRRGHTVQLRGCDALLATILENSIASASINYESSYEGLTVDALAPGADEGRVRLRKASGSRQEGWDPRVSEWGNPAGVMPGHPGLNT
jgi:hypothetical protein